MSTIPVIPVKELHAMILKAALDNHGSIHYNDIVTPELSVGQTVRYTEALNYLVKVQYLNPPRNQSYLITPFGQRAYDAYMATSPEQPE